MTGWNPEPRFRKPFIPFPKVWNALHGEPELLKVLKGMPFAGLFEVSRLHAVEGIDAVRAHLRRIADAPSRERPVPGYRTEADETTSHDHVQNQQKDYADV